MIARDHRVSGEAWEMQMQKFFVNYGETGIMCTECGNLWFASCDSVLNTHTHTCITRTHVLCVFQYEYIQLMLLVYGRASSLKLQTWAERFSFVPSLPTSHRTVHGLGKIFKLRYPQLPPPQILGKEHSSWRLFWVTWFLAWSCSLNVSLFHISYIP